MLSGAKPTHSVSDLRSDQTCPSSSKLAEPIVTLVSDRVTLVREDCEAIQAHSQSLQESSVLRSELVILIEVRVTLDCEDIKQQAHKREEVLKNKVYKKPQKILQKNTNKRDIS